MSAVRPGSGEFTELARLPSLTKAPAAESSLSQSAQRPGSAKGETELPAAYLDYLSSLRSAWPDLPSLTITYDQLAYGVQVPVKNRSIPSQWTALRDAVTGLNPLANRAAKTKLFQPLHACSGVVRPGEMTLVLAPPGHGKSVLLKALAGRLGRDGDALKGEVRWNGLTAAESAAAGQQLSKLAVFVDQGDVHFPMLTVRETFQFALDNSNADSALLGSPDFDAKQKQKVDLIMELLGLNECADTIVGNSVMRGVSGGQRKRVTLGEMMIGQARALFLDEISTGLDAAATFDIGSALKRWARVMGGSAVVALLQPSPEVFDLFDNLIIMREGHIIFSGTQSQLRRHLADCNIVPNPHVDFADWLTEFASDPPIVWQRDVQLQAKRHASMMLAAESAGQQVPPAQPLSAPAAAAPARPQTLQPLARSSSGASGAVGLSSFSEEGGAAEQGSDRKVVVHMDPSEADATAAAPTSASAASAAIGGDASQSLSLPGATTAAADSGSAAPSKEKRKALGQIISSKDVPLSTMALRKRFHDSAVYKDLMAEISTRNMAAKERSAAAATSASASASAPGTSTSAAGTPSAFTLAQFYSPYSHSLWTHTLANLRRQELILLRNKAFIIPGLVQAAVMGLIFGSLFWQLSTGVKDFSARIGLALFTLTFVSFANMAEVPQAAEYKKVIYKQLDAGFYSTFAYCVSVVLLHFPLAIAETAVFGALVYAMAGFDMDAGRFLFFLLTLLMVNLVVGAIFRCLAYAFQSSQVAVSMAGPLVSLMILFSGFVIGEKNIPDWLIWCFWISPFSWGLRSNAINEFSSPRYPAGVGDRYMAVWQIDSNPSFKWAGIGFLGGVFVLFLFVSAWILKSKRTALTSGTKRSHDEEEALEADQAAVEGRDAPQAGSPGSGGAIEVRIGAKTTSMIAESALAQQREDANNLSFTRMDLAFSDLRYSVTVKELDEKTGKMVTRERTLLNGINGFAKAGELTALMGSSGAGKTTLMDCIAGRKNVGKLSGQILINGHPQTFPAFSRIAGYCEQQDNHCGLATVREAIAFSARLRLPSTVSGEARRRFVDQILADLELAPIADRLIGDANIEGLSPGELKRVTIAVELAANPTFLFLDEPTSGLDSRAALIVLRVIRKIARRGRSVICTVHQPSAELFSQFDRLLLLKSGGREVYCGPIGPDGSAVARYFMSAAIDPKFYRPQPPDQVNVASWMLDVVGAGTSAKGLIAPYDEVYSDSALRAENLAEVARLSVPAAGSSPVHFSSAYACSYATQLRLVLGRLGTVFWRDVSYVTTKVRVLLFLGLLIGLVFLGIDDSDEAGLTSKVGIMGMSAGLFGIINSSSALPLIFRLRESFYRERASHTYAPIVYSTSLAIVELPYLVVATVAFTTPFYFLVGMKNEAGAFFQYTFVMYLCALFFTYAGQLFASLLSNMQTASILQSVCITLWFLFSGVFINRGAMPEGWVFMYVLNPLSKVMVSLAIPQFYCADESPAGCPQLVSVQHGGVVSQWEFVSSYLASGKGWEWTYVGWLVVSIAVVRLLVAVSVQRVVHLTR